MMRSIVLLAPNGQVGFEVARAIAPLGTLHTLSRQDVDFSDTEEVVKKVSALAPDIIINAAAWTAVDKAEAERDAAYLLNATLPGALAKIAKQHNAWLVHYSSDYVYPGHGSQAWKETDATGPLSVYGESKLAGDVKVAENTDKFLIFRTSWVYAARGNNFMRTMLSLAQSREALSVVADQVGAPTPARLIAQVTVLALHQVLQAELDNEESSANRFSGVYHLAPRGHASWYDFAAEIFKLAHESGIELKLDTDYFKPITTAEYPTPAARPVNSRLDLSKIEQTFNLQMPDWKEQVAFTFSELNRP